MKNTNQQFPFPDFMPEERSTQIMITYGPACKDMIKEMIWEGISYVRINCSHLKGEEELEDALSAMRRIDAINKTIGSKVKVLIDLGGPKIRTGVNIDGKPVVLDAGDEVTLMAYPAQTIGKRISVWNYPQFAADVKPDHRILIDDARVELRVISSKDGKVTCLVIRGGIITSRKGINLPDTFVSLPALTDTDVWHVNYFLKNAPKGVIAMFGLSFVQHAYEVLKLKELLKNTGIGICSKIERPNALWHSLKDIILYSDWGMIARGDLSSEIEIEDLPIAQRMIHMACKQTGIPTILATSVLRSMEDSLRPSIGDNEALFVAILDGYDIIMLSNETSVGKYPMECIKHVKEVIEAVDRYRNS